MSDSDNVNTSLILFMQKAVDLANSIGNDVKAKGYISEATLELLNQFHAMHDELNERLEANSGLH